MNRPFYAFGVLMAFLALAMLAIGLSSRPASKPSSAGDSDSELPRRQPGVTLFVLVLPDAETAEMLGLPTDEDQVVLQSGCGLATQHPSYAQGCGLDRATGNVYFAHNRSPISSAADIAVAQTGLRPATIEQAGPVILDDVVRNSLATGYDADYDRAMAAETVGQRDDLSLAPAMSDPTALEQDDPLLVVFNSLSRRETTQIEQKSYLAQLRQRRWDYEARAILNGAQNRVWRLFIAAGIADQWRHAGEQTGLIGATQANHLSGPTWAEYTAWIGSKQWTVAWRDTQNGRSVSFWNQPNDQLLQIAVAGLNRVAELLHEALVQLLDKAAEQIARRADRAAAGLAPK